MGCPSQYRENIPEGQAGRGPSCVHHQSASFFFSMSINGVKAFSLAKESFNKPSIFYQDLQMQCCRSGLSKRDKTQAI